MSRTFNRHQEHGIVECINRLRIEEAKRLLLTQRYTIKTRSPAFRLL